MSEVTVSCARRQAATVSQAVQVSLFVELSLFKSIRLCQSPPLSVSPPALCLSSLRGSVTASNLSLSRPGPILSDLEKEYVLLFCIKLGLRFPF